jgi:tRNA/rRNA methyltransferase
MNTVNPSYRKVREFIKTIDSAVIPTDSNIAQQARNVFSKDDAFTFSKQAYTGPTIVLVRPYDSKNIGSVARSMLNFGLTDLRIVKPREDWQNRDALECASGAREILQNAVVYDDLSEAVADMQTIYATTARYRDSNKPDPQLPREAAEQIATSIQGGRRVCILFGSERNGLSNEEVEVAHELVSIPSNMMFGSLNLSHAVMVLAYECWLALLSVNAKRSQKLAGQAGDVAEGGAEAEESVLSADAAPATFSQTEALFERLKLGLEATTRFPPERAQTVYPKLHNLILRLRPNAAEVRLMHGVVRAVFGQPADLLPKRAAHVDERARAAPAATGSAGDDFDEQES